MGRPLYSKVSTCEVKIMVDLEAESSVGDLGTKAYSSTGTTEEMTRMGKIMGLCC